MKSRMIDTSTAEDAKDEHMTTDIIKREQTEEERVFTRFCDCVDAHLKWRGLPPIASNEEQRRQRAMTYLLKSIEAYQWFAGLVGGIEMFEKVMGGGKRMEVETEQSASTQVVKRKPHVVTRGGWR